MTSNFAPKQSSFAEETTDLITYKAQQEFNKLLVQNNLQLDNFSKFETQGPQLVLQFGDMLQEMANKAS
jgi:hypothetical protein